MAIFLLNTHIVTFATLGMGIVAIAGLVLWLYALVDILRSEFKIPSNKIIWLLMLMFIPFLGMIFYFVFGQKQKEEEEEEVGA